MIHSKPCLSFVHDLKKRYVTKPATTPAILMTKAVYDGFRRALPEAAEIKNGWFKKIDITIPDYSEKFMAAM